MPNRTNQTHLTEDEAREICDMHDVGFTDFAPYLQPTNDVCRSHGWDAHKVFERAITDAKDETAERVRYGSMVGAR